MSFVKYEGLGKPNEVLAKIRDYIVQEGFTVVEDCVDDLDIFERNITDGKKLVFKDKTNNYFVCMRSMNGYQIFPEMANGTANPEGKTLPTAQSSNFCGIGVIGSEGYSATNRWYDQYLAPKKVNTGTTVGVGLKIAGESPTITILPNGYIPEEYWGVDKTGRLKTTYLGDTGTVKRTTTTTDNNSGTVTTRVYDWVSYPIPYTVKQDSNLLMEILDNNNQPVSYNSDRDNFSFNLDVYYDLTEYKDKTKRDNLLNNFKQLISSGVVKQSITYPVLIPLNVRDKTTNNIIATIDAGLVGLVNMDANEPSGLVFNYISTIPPEQFSSVVYRITDGAIMTNLTANNRTFLKYQDFPISNFSILGSFPPLTATIRFHIPRIRNTIRVAVTQNGRFLENFYGYQECMVYYNYAYAYTHYTIGGTTSYDYVANEYSMLKPIQAQIKGSNNIIDVKYLNPSTLYCNHITTPVDTLIFTLVDQVYGTHQHLVIGNVNKYANWDGGLYLSSSHNSYTLSSDLYTNRNNSNVLPTLSSTELGCTTFLRINVDEAPIKNKIYWASSGKPDTQDPKQCYTGKQLAMPIRYGEGVTGTWRAKIPHYGYLQSRSVNDAGVNCNTLNCITINLPLYMAVKVDPDSLNNFAPVGEVNGVYLVSMLNMGTGSLYEISYPNSGNLHQVFSMDRRRGNYFYDGVAIAQEDNT